MIKMLIEKYESYIKNLKSHIHYNSDYINECDMKHIKKRITDFEEMLEDLKLIQKVAIV